MQAGFFIGECLGLGSTVSGDGLAGHPGRGPGGLKIEASGNAVDVQRLAGEIQAGNLPAFHGLHVDLLQGNPPASDKLLLVHAFADDLEFGFMKFLEEENFLFARKFRPALVWGYTDGTAQLFP